MASHCKQGKIARLDFKHLVSFRNPGVFVRIDPQVQDAIRELTEVDERVQGVARMCFHLGALGDEPGNDNLRRSRMYLRAALAEYASMEDAAVLDFERLSAGMPSRIRELDDPRLHVVRLLRHANVHLATTRVSSAERAAVWDGPDGPREFMYRMMLAEDLDSSIQTTRGAKAYAASDLAAMLEWLRSEQQEWGIQHVVLRTAERYADVLQMQFHAAKT